MNKASSTIKRGAVYDGYALGGVRRSAYERAASMLLSLLILFGAVVVVLLVILLTNRVFVQQLAVPVKLEEVGTGDGEGPAGGGSGMDPNPPPPEEAMNLEPPVDTPLNTVSNVIASQETMLADPMWDDRPRVGYGHGIGRGVGDGIGDGRGGPPPRRWEVRFPPGNTLSAYGRQLDYFGIELAVLMPEGKVQYAFNFSGLKPQTRVGATEAEKRYYLTWRRGRDELAEADRELLRRAGVPVEGKIILKFLPPKVEAQLAALEKQKADQRGEKRVRKTVFDIRAQTTGYTFVVSDQAYESG